MPSHNRKTRARVGKFSRAVGDRWSKRPNVTIYGTGESSNTDHLPKPRNGAENININMDEVNVLEIAVGQKKLEAYKPAKSRAGRASGTEVGDVAEGQTGNGDKAALEKFKGGIEIGDTIETYGNLPKGHTVTNTKTLEEDTAKQVTNTWEFVDDYKVKLLNSDTTQKSQ